MVDDIMGESEGSHDSVGAHDDAGHGHERPHEGATRAVGRRLPCEDGQDIHGEIGRRSHPEDPGEEGIAGAIAALEGVPPEDYQRLAAFFSGALPPPDIYYAYEPEDRERMCRWNDSGTVDESRRQDEIVAAEIKQGARSQLFSFVLNMSFLAASFASFVLTQNPASFGFLAVPGLTVAVNFHRGRGKKLAG